MIDKITVGWREWLALPELGIPAIKAKVDTGARSSALHVTEPQIVLLQGQRRVRFRLTPLRRRPELALHCEAEVVDERLVRDSGGHAEQRLVILTPVRLGGRMWPIEITLASRHDMLFPMLLGRTAMQGRLLVDPGQSFLHGRRPRGVYPHTKKTK